MTPDQRLKSIIDKHRLPKESITKSFNLAKQIIPYVREWGDWSLSGIKISGSFAKGTVIDGSDLDLLISLDPNTPGTLRGIYEGLYIYLDYKGLHPQRRNAAIRISREDVSIDLIPGRKRSGNTNYHSIWLNLENTWTQANTDIQSNYVRRSERMREIKLTKIWRELYGLNFPSFYLELVVIKALSGKKQNSLRSNFRTVLKYIRDNLPSLNVTDPSNSNNHISKTLNYKEKQALAYAAQRMLN